MEYFSLKILVVPLEKAVKVLMILIFYIYSVAEIIVRYANELH